MAHLESRITGLVDAGALPCAALVVVQDGQPALRIEHGFADLGDRRAIGPQTLYRIFSMTKPVTAVAAMLLVQDGRLLLDDHVERHVPEFARLQVARPDGSLEPARPMTVEHLLTHTSGLSYSFNPDSHAAPFYRKAGLEGGAWSSAPDMTGLDVLAQRLATIPLDFQPGTRWQYSMGPDILGLIIERVAGMSFDRFLAERVFTPLGMSDTAFAIPQGKRDRIASLYTPGPSGLSKLPGAVASVPERPPLAPSGGGGLISSLDDYLRFAQMLCDDGGGLLGRPIVDLMTANHLRPDQTAGLEAAARFGYGGSGAGLGFGLGGAVVADVAQSHSPGVVGEYGWGGAASTTFWVDRVNRIVVVFMTQLLPSGAIPVRDLLKAMVYGALPAN
ncbi:serine hydrolase domain-containing protein [Phenylobacterium sp.]|uniref:serine hydrolase domain-containing protein n=1 Tax=Phenylobacterium sp. TaxID=1871053 RepID=UPI0035B4C626